MSADSFTVTCHVEAPLERVWSCLTQPGCYKAWWRDDICFEARLGGRLREPWRDRAGRERLTEARIISFHPPFGMVMVWADQDWAFDTVVAITVERDGAGSRVHVEHQGWTLAPGFDRDRLFHEHRAGWTTHLANMSAHAVGHGGAGRH